MFLNTLFFFIYKKNTTHANSHYNIKMERGLVMLLHSIIIGIVIYFIMIYLGQNKILAENRSILLSTLILTYMILFGHGLVQ